MATVLYPSALPCPQTSVVTPAERRALSNTNRPREARNMQRDRLEYERITWPPLDAAKAETILVFWRDTLQHGGAWFVADWPLPRGRYVQAVRKFREQPKWQFVPGGFWQLSALCEVRGQGMLIDDQVVSGGGGGGGGGGELGTIIFKTSFEPGGVGDIGTYTKTVATTWAKTGAYSAHYYGDYASSGTAILISPMQAWADITFILRVPATVTHNLGLRLINIGTYGINLNVNSGGAVTLSYADSYTTVVIGSLGVDIAVRLVLGLAASSVYVNGSTTAISTIGPTTLNHSGTSVDLFHGGTDNYTGTAFEFYVDDFQIVTGDGPPPIGPAVYLRDSFTGTTGTDLESHTPEIGSAWAVNIAGTLKLESNRLEHNATSGTTTFWSTTTIPVTDNLYVQFKVRFTSNTVCEFDIARTAHIAGNSDKFFEIHFEDVATPDSNYYQLGSNFPIGDLILLDQLNHDYLVRIEAEGTDLRFYFDGVLIATAPLAQDWVQGPIGGFFTEITSSSVLRFDDFEVGSF